MTEDSFHDKFAEYMKEDVPDTNEDILDQTLKLRFGIIKDKLSQDTSNESLSLVDKLASGIDRQVVARMKMSQDQEDGAANREVALSIFDKMVQDNVHLTPKTAVASPDIEDSGLEILDGELLDGDDTRNSVMK